MTRIPDNDLAEALFLAIILVDAPMGFEADAPVADARLKELEALPGGGALVRRLKAAVADWRAGLNDPSVKAVSRHWVATRHLAEARRYYAAVRLTEILGQYGLGRADKAGAR